MRGLPQSGQDTEGKRELLKENLAGNTKGLSSHGLTRCRI